MSKKVPKVSNKTNIIKKLDDTSASRKIGELITLVKTNFKKYSPTFTTDELVKILKKLSDSYYNTGESLVDDTTYDSVKELLEQKDPSHSFLEEVGAPVKGTKEKVDLPFEMGSLTKIKPDSGDLEKFSERYVGPYVASDKLDGASVQLYKDKKGKVTLYSRGNGKVGQDITHLLKFIVPDNVLEELPNDTSVRGELIISKKDFKKISSYMKNARNAVSGLVNSKTVDVKVAKITQMITYAVLHPKHKQSEQLKLLKKWGFNVVNYVIESKLDEQNSQDFLLQRKKLSDFEMDGIVYADDSRAYNETGGYPDHAFAFKMLLNDQIALADVVDIEWDVSMDGYVKPRVKINPVDLLGTTITYATGFNAKFINENKLGPGAQIKLVRSGDVIPYILEVTKPSTSGNPKMPDFEYEWNETRVDIIADKKDKNATKTITLKLLIHFFASMGIKYLGEGILAKFVDAGLDSVVKIISAKRKDFIDMEGVGEKMIKKIYNEIARAFAEVDLATFMGASHKFGRSLGIRKMEEIVAVYPQIMKNKWTKSEMVEKIKEIQGFADKTATMFADNFQEFKKFYDEIAKVVDLTRFDEIKVDSNDSDDSDDSNSDSDEKLQKKVKQSKKPNKLFDTEKIVFTGFRDKELEKNIKANGGKVSTSVSSNTTILVHADSADKSSSKFTKATKLGTKLMSVTEFKQTYNLK